MVLGLGLFLAASSVKVAAAHYSSTANEATAPTSHQVAGARCTCWFVPLHLQRQLFNKKK